MPVTPLSPLHGQLDRNYGQAAARILLARLSSRLRLQTVHRAFALRLSPSEGAQQGLFHTAESAIAVDVMVDGAP